MLSSSTPEFLKANYDPFNENEVNEDKTSLFKQ